MAHSPLASPSAAIAVLRENGLFTRKAYGQHLLVDDNVIGRILTLAGLSLSDVVLEVGPGIGTLTIPLCSHAGAVVAVERDDRLIPVLRRTTEGCPGLEIVHADAVSVDPDRLVTALGPPTALVANLPYAVAATVVLRFLECLPGLRTATVMVQSEVADRMCAVPGTKEYGAYTVKLRLLARASGRFAVARTCFLPPPRVDSAVLRLERATRPEPAEVLGRAARAATAGFAQRRKRLGNSVAASLGIPVAAVDTAIESAGIEPARRAETLEVEEFVALGEALHTAGLLG
ncbi:MAG: 16S rRNA (adenine(1518)-N(6)/adenine(1519)-N(6))-dimethyltransferase RsmA [Coriobacteriia bacterium]